MVGRASEPFGHVGVVKQVLARPDGDEAHGLRLHRECYEVLHAHDTLIVRQADSESHGIGTASFASVTGAGFAASA
jgi:hypothetical protein